MKKDHLIIGLMITLFVVVVFMGKCNRPEAPVSVPAGADPFQPVLEILKQQRQTDSLHIVSLQAKVDSLQTPKKQAKQKAAAAIAKGEQTNDCDSLRTAFNELKEGHEQYVAVTEEENATRGFQLQRAQKINQSLATENEVLNIQVRNLKSNYEGLSAISEKIRKDLDKSERKAKRRGNILKVVYAAAAVKATIEIIKIL